MTYCSGFTRHQPCHANFKRIHSSDSEETNTCCVKNDTKTIVGFYLKPV